MSWKAMEFKLLIQSIKGYVLLKIILKCDGVTIGVNQENPPMFHGKLECILADMYCTSKWVLLLAIILQKKTPCPNK